MSILISHKWMEEYLGLKLDAGSLPEMLTNAGLEVEAIKYGQILSDKFVIGFVESVKPHENSKKLNCCKVNIGSEILDIVCGCSTVRSNIFVVVATVGAVMPNGMEIQATKLRGEASNGMICSASELGLAEEAKGILILNIDCQVGIPASSVIDTDDMFLDISLTPDRGDCFSIRGVAREAIALQYGKSLPETDLVAFDKDYNKPRPLSSYILYEVSCSKQELPFSWRQRLISSGYQSQDFWVDFTQYYMHEIGQPMHAFDADKINGTPYVRYAVDGESIEVLGGKLINLTPDILVVSDDDGPIAVAGIIGGQASAVSDSTRRVFLEIASFPKDDIAKACQILNIHTSASDRFARGVDPAMAFAASTTIKEFFADSVVSSKGYLHLPEKVKIVISYSEITRVLGSSSDPEALLQSLASRGFDVKLAEQKASVMVPTVRTDITSGIELIEEMLRIAGHQDWPASNYSDIVSSSSIEKKDSLANFLLAHEFSEMITYSFIDPSWLKKLNMANAEKYVLLNPMSKDMSVMRPSAYFGLLDRLSYNAKRQVICGRVYEQGLVFGEEETEVIAGVSLVNKSNTWHEKTEESFYSIKSLLQCYLSGISDVDYRIEDFPVWYHPYATAAIYLSGKKLGYVGVLHPKLSAVFSLPSAIGFELDVSVLRECNAVNKVIVSDVPKFPGSRKDLSFYADSGIKYSDILNVIKSLNIQEVIKIELFDIYVSDRISYSISLLFQSYNRTLSDVEIMEKVSNIVQALEAKLNLELRGDLCQGNQQKQKQT